MAGWTSDEVEIIRRWCAGKPIAQLLEALRNSTGDARQLLDTISRSFPNWNSERVEFTSPRTAEYNCIAWSTGDTTQWWWPGPFGGHWPKGISRDVTIEAFVEMYQSLGYAPCGSGELESEFEKVALYVKDGAPTHAARQLPTGRWTSKLGGLEDVEHDLEDLESPVGSYGQVHSYFKRAVGNTNRGC